MKISKCCAKNCPGNEDGTVKLFRFPDNNIFEWCRNLRIYPKDLRPSSRVCSRHFTADCMGKQKLRTGAMPTLNLGHDGYLEYLSDMAPLVGKPKWIKRCCVNGCTSESPPTNFFMLRSEWRNLIEIKNGYDMLHLFICAFHFDRNRISRKRLLPDTLPKYKLTGNADIDEVDDEPLVDIMNIEECSLDSQPSSSVKRKNNSDCTDCGDFYRKKYFALIEDSKKELDSIRNMHKAETDQLNRKILALEKQKPSGSVTVFVKECNQVKRYDIQNMSIL